MTELQKRYDIRRRKQRIRELSLAITQAQATGDPAVAGLLVKFKPGLSHQRMQAHLAAQSNKLNGIMKALAMVSTVILPMSLISASTV